MLPPSIMKKTDQKRLTLRRETVHAMQLIELQHVVAGLATGTVNNGEAYTCTCNTNDGGGGRHDQM
jgi:hypothetical protein